MRRDCCADICRLKCRAARSGSIRKLANEAENDFSRIAANVRKGWEAVKNVMSGHKPSSQLEEGYGERPSNQFGSEREDEVDALFEKGKPTNADACRRQIYLSHSGVALNLTNRATVVTDERSANASYDPVSSRVL